MIRRTVFFQRGFALKALQSAVLFFVMAALLGGGSIQAASGEKTIFFYNPESNVNNFASLKKNMDNYLLKFGKYQFQPFGDRATFEKHALAKGGGVYLVSSWHYKMLKEKMALKPLLVGVYKSKSIQRAVLTSKPVIRDLKSLKGRTLAAAGEEKLAKNILRSMLGGDKKDIIDTITLLTVPKDIDALMAVGFGMAECALTSERSLSKLKSLNPKQYKALNKLAKGGEELLPIVAALESQANSEATKKLVRIIEDMPKSSDGSRKLKMLGLDGWKRIDKPEMAILDR
ncbi:hypothetical protein MNBD_NITROSPINAE04-628 [hydrothermal vent metagenome]|uniref:Solute-binding protein family 3/N-terminal domain-containing protein n=1 Tax=hydrothermal vent metagenome TaxID=652676 RepID=A0A3B1CMJ4_9ZZZZ